MQLFKSIKQTAFAAAALALCSPALSAVVYSNGTAPGDAYTSPSTSGTGQAVGASGWYYNNVRNNGVVGIDTSYARSGNGSAHLGGAAGTKGDIEFLPSAVAVGGNYNSGASLGSFTALTGMSYDWYRSSSSGANAHLHASLRVLLDLDGNLSTTNDRGGLVFERAYNPSVSPVPTDVWNSDAVGVSTKLWNFGLGLGNEFNIDGQGDQYDTLATWQASGRMANAKIIGFSSGFGSGWGTYEGAVDNIAWTINGVSTTNNFEVTGAAVPEPASLALVGVALLGMAGVQRVSRKKR